MESSDSSLVVVDEEAIDWSSIVEASFNLRVVAIDIKLDCKPSMEEAFMEVSDSDSLGSTIE